MTDTNNLDIKILKTLLEGRSFGSQVHLLNEVESTNEKAIQLADQGAPHGTLVVARTQLAGRGRFDRKWKSPEGGLCSLSYCAHRRLTRIPLP